MIKISTLILHSYLHALAVPPKASNVNRDRLVVHQITTIDRMSRERLDYLGDTTLPMLSLV
jgi:hypothetical protein